MSVKIVIYLLATCMIQCIIGPPLEKQQKQEANHNQTEQMDLGIKYEKYLREVIQALETDEGFRKKLETADVEDIKTGKIAEQLQFVDHNIRSQLDELKREEVNRLRKYARQHKELSNGSDNVQFNGMNRNFLPPPDHIDARNPHTFEIHDLERLMVQTTRDLEEADRKRRDEFKAYEMEKEHERREKLKSLSEEEQKRLQVQYEEMQKKHKEHPKLHHPGSKQQLEDVWEEKDHMQREDFNPKTFFLLHDIDGNGYWSPEEVSALFQNELDKLYERGMPEDDMMERYEEMQRMREHVYNETDVNRDGLISLQEFMGLAQSRDFNNDPGWEGLDEQQIYSQQEYEEFERHRQEMMRRGAPMYAPNSIDPRAQYQHVPQAQQHQRYPQGQGYVPSDHGVHPQVSGQYGNVQYQQPNVHPNSYDFQQQQVQAHQFQAGLGPHNPGIQQQQNQYQQMVQQQQQFNAQPQVVPQQGSQQHPQVVQQQQHQQGYQQQPQVVQQQGGYQNPQVLQQQQQQQQHEVPQHQQGSQGQQPVGGSQQVPEQKPSSPDGIETSSKQDQQQQQNVSH